MKKSNEKSRTPQSGFSAYDLIRLGSDGFVKMAELYSKVTTRWQKQLSGGNWMSVSELERSIPTGYCNTYIRLGLPLPPLDGLDNHALVRRGIATELIVRFLDDENYEVRVPNGDEQIRLRPSAVKLKHQRKSTGKSVPAKDQQPHWQQPERVKTVWPRYFEHCQGCGVLVGEWHRPGCTLELCPYCGKTACKFAARRNSEKACPTVQMFGQAPVDDRIRYDGYLPGEREAVEFGWWAYETRDTEVVYCCEPDHPDAFPHNDRVEDTAVWDRDNKKFVLPVK